jgi:thioredoxin-related protein
MRIMKKLFLLLPLAFLSLVAFRNPNEPLAIGSTLPHPEAKMKDISGKEVSFSDATGKNGLLVMFSCNTCPVVGKYQSRTIEIGKYASSKNIGVIVLNSNEATRSDGESFEDMQAYGKDQGYEFPYVLDADSRMADAFGATRTPELFLFNMNGKLVYHGAIDDNANDPSAVTRKHAAIAIDETVAGKTVETPKTRFVGCGIKRL